MSTIGHFEWVAFWGDGDIAITWSGSTLLNQHVLELLEISMRNFLGKQTQGKTNMQKYLVLL